MTKSTRLKKRTALISWLLTVTSLAFCNLSALPSPVFAQASTSREVWVLFPMARDAQKIKVSLDRDGDMIYQDDIVIDESQIVTDPTSGGTRTVDLIMQARRAQARQSGRASVFSAGTATWWVRWGRWLHAVIPYKIADDMPQDYRDLIAQAIDHINSKTNLCLRTKKGDDDDYVEFTPVRDKPYSGQSRLGRVGGRQKIKLNVEKAGFKTVVHEILHAAGMIHEQSRSDRDSFVEILWDNIDPEPASLRDNFEIDQQSENYTSYDFNSVMHYSPTAFGIERNGTRLETIRARNNGDTIAPSRTLTDLDVAGVNQTYPDAITCTQRVRWIEVAEIRANGSIGSALSRDTVGTGWYEAQPLSVGDLTTHMMLLNRQSDTVKIREVNRDGTLGDEVYNKKWDAGWEDLEALKINGATYILNHRRFPLTQTPNGEVDLFESLQGATEIRKVNTAAPFEDNRQGDKVYDRVWGRGWRVIKFFTVGDDFFVFRYNRESGRVQIYEIDKQNPFANNSLGELAYNAPFNNNWDVIQFFKIGDKTYCFFLKTPSGQVRIREVTSSGALGNEKYADTWTPGWNNVAFFQHSDGNTYFITIKSSTGRIHYSRFKRDDPFSNRTPYDIVLNTTWTKGWTFSNFYAARDGFRLFLMKE